MWSGQEFDRWKVEVEKWFDNNKSTDDEKYLYSMESVKMNESLKDFVVKTLEEKAGETRKIKRVLEVMIEKFAKTTG